MQTSATSTGAATLASSKTYTDGSIASTAASLAASISSSLSTSQRYTDGAVATERSSGRAYTDAASQSLSATVNGVIVSVDGVSSTAQATSAVRSYVIRFCISFIHLSFGCLSTGAELVQDQQ